MKILVIGNYGNHNIGDEAILKGIIEEFREKYSNKTEFYIITRNPDFISTYHPELGGTIHTTRVNILNILRIIIHMDLVIVGGGGIWSKYTGPLAHFIPLYIIFIKLFYRKKILFKNIGIYKTASIIDRFLVNLAILISDSCSVRDIESYKVLWKINKSKSIVEVDQAIIYIVNRVKKSGLPESKENKLLKIMNSNQKCSISLGFALKPLINTKETALSIREIVKTINKLSYIYKDRICLVFFIFSKNKSSRENDQVIVDSIVKRIPKNDKISFEILNLYDPFSLYILMKKLIDILIGMRYHSILFGYLANVPIIAIPYEHKILQFLKISKPRYRLIYDLDSDVVVNTIMEIIDKETIKGELQA